MLLHLLPTALRPSPTNGREHSGLDDKSLAELAASIRTHGVLEPLLVRPLTPPAGEVTHEIICGERRWTAARTLTPPVRLPCLVRECDDATVRQLQTVENLQRVGLHRLEEAAHLRQLREVTGLSVEAIAATVGKTPQWVYACLKLDRLPDPVKLACRSGRCADTVALLLARIPDPADQLKAADDVLRPGQADPLTFRAAKAHIEAHYMRRLRGAPFDTAACAACPHRTGNQRALYPDVDCADLCTRPACYRQKAGQAHRATRRPAAAAPANAPASPAPAHRLSPRQLGHARDLTYSMIADPETPGRARPWLLWLVQHGPNPVTADDLNKLGVVPKQHAAYLAEAPIGRLVSLLVRKALAGPLTGPDHQLTPAYHAALDLAQLHL